MERKLTVTCREFIENGKEPIVKNLGFYDKILDKFFIYNGKEWEEYLIDTSINHCGGVIQ